MLKRHGVALVAAAAFVFTVWFANWLVNRYGPIRVWPTDLRAPAGVYVVGVAFLLRDTVQRFSGQKLAFAAIAAGTFLSVFVNVDLALASGAAFAASEVIGLLLFWVLGGNRGGRAQLAVAVIVASLVAAAVDSYVFLSLAPTFIPGVDNVDAFFEGQFVAKISVLALALPFVVIARRVSPTPAVPEPA